MNWRTDSSGRRLIGVKAATAEGRIEMIGDSEPVECAETGVTEYGYDWGELGENIVPAMPESVKALLARHAKGAVTVSKASQAVADYWAVGHMLCTDVGMEFGELLRAVKDCEKENRRHRRGQQKLRTQVSGAMEGR